MNKVLFLDRDGVINVEKHYLYKIEDFEFIDGVFEACRYFISCGYQIIIITNQGGISKGLYTQKDFEILTLWMLEAFKKEHIDILAVYHCPHHPDMGDVCACRKPKIGLIEKACSDFEIDLAHSILIGDKNSDIECGMSARIGKNYLISTGHKIDKNIFGVKILDNLKDLVKKEKDE